eukprot:g17907.t1
MRGEIFRERQMGRFERERLDAETRDVLHGYDVRGYEGFEICAEEFGEDLFADEPSVEAGGRAAAAVAHRRPIVPFEENDPQSHRHPVFYGKANADFHRAFPVLRLKSKFYYFVQHVKQDGLQFFFAKVVTGQVGQTTQDARAQPQFLALRRFETRLKRTFSVLDDRMVNAAKVGAHHQHHGGGGAVHFIERVLSSTWPLFGWLSQPPWRLPDMGAETAALVAGEKTFLEWIKDQIYTVPEEVVSAVRRRKLASEEELSNKWPVSTRVEQIVDKWDEQMEGEGRAGANEKSIVRNARPLAPLANLLIQMHDHERLRRLEVVYEDGDRRLVVPQKVLRIVRLTYKRIANFYRKYVGVGGRTGRDKDPQQINSNSEKQKNEKFFQYLSLGAVHIPRRSVTPSSSVFFIENADETVRWDRFLAKKDRMFDPSTTRTRTSTSSKKHPLKPGVPVPGYRELGGEGRNQDFPPILESLEFDEKVHGKIPYYFEDEKEWRFIGRAVGIQGRDVKREEKKLYEKFAVHALITEKNVPVGHFSSVIVLPRHPKFVRTNDGSGDILQKESLDETDYDQETSPYASPELMYHFLQLLQILQDLLFHRGTCPWDEKDARKRGYLVKTATSAPEEFYFCVNPFWESENTMSTQFRLFGLWAECETLLDVVAKRSRQKFRVSGGKSSCEAAIDVGANYGACSMRLATARRAAEAFDWEPMLFHGAAQLAEIETTFLGRPGGYSGIPAPELANTIYVPVFDKWLPDSIEARMGKDGKRTTEKKQTEGMHPWLRTQLGGGLQTFGDDANIAPGARLKAKPPVDTDSPLRHPEDVDRNPSSYDRQRARGIGYQVLAVEPVHWNTAFTQGSIFSNHLEHQVKLVRAAATSPENANTDTNSSLVFSVPHQDTELGGLFTKDELSVTDDKQRTDFDDVPLRTLDEILRNEDLCLLKTDTEGHDHDVVRGARGLLTQMREEGGTLPVISAEVNADAQHRIYRRTDALAGTTLLNFAAEMGYGDMVSAAPKGDLIVPAGDELLPPDGGAFMLSGGKMSEDITVGEKMAPATTWNTISSRHRVSVFSEGQDSDEGGQRELKPGLRSSGRSGSRHDADSIHLLYEQEMSRSLPFVWFLHATWSEDRSDVICDIELDFVVGGGRGGDVDEKRVVAVEEALRRGDQHADTGDEEWLRLRVVDRWAAPGRNANGGGQQEQQQSGGGRTTDYFRSFARRLWATFVEQVWLPASVPGAEEDEKRNNFEHLLSEEFHQEGEGAATATFWLDVGELKKMHLRFRTHTDAKMRAQAARNNFQFGNNLPVVSSMHPSIPSLRELVPSLMQTCWQGCADLSFENARAGEGLNSTQGDFLDPSSPACRCLHLAPTIDPIRSDSNLEERERMLEVFGRNPMQGFGSVRPARDTAHHVACATAEIGDTGSGRLDVVS